MLPAASPLAEGNALSRFGLGVRYSFRGLVVVLTEVRLWPFVVAPALITSVLLVVALLATLTIVPLLMGFVWTPGPHVPAWLRLTWWLLTVMLQASIFVVVAVGLYFLSGLIATPFYDTLSQKVEDGVLGESEVPFSWPRFLADVRYSVAHTMLSLLIWSVLMLSLLLLNVVPVVGSFLEVVLSWAITAFFLARETMDGCMSRRRFTFREKLGIVVTHLPLMLGFGTVATFMLWIPLLNFLAMPMAVAGGTLLYCQLEQQGLIGPKPRNT